jgi:hypothetical protein
MKYLPTLILALAGMSSLSAQQTAGFENIPLPPAGYLNDASPDPVFSSGPVRIPNTYNPAFNYWEGWAVSSVTDNQTPGFTNQYSAIPGTGAAGTAQYTVSYAFDGAVMYLEGPAAGQPVEGLYVTNSTYTYYTIRDGDTFSKKFGGENGNDPDFFRLNIRGWLNGQLTADSAVVYLADYRFSNNQQDYILDQWTWVDLQGLGPVDSLRFTLASSDVGAFGMNTPAYFCVDEVRTAGDPSAWTSLPAALPLSVWPNPAGPTLQVEAPQGATWGEVRDAWGRLHLRVAMTGGWQQLDLSVLPAGSYVLRISGGQQVGLARFIRM